MSTLLHTDGPRRLRDDRGFILIEVLVSAIILVTISLAVFATLSKSDAVAGQQQKRALAANAAQSLLEQIRAMPVEDIAAQRGKGKPYTFGRDTYTVDTTAKWVTDGADEPECSSRTGGLDYLRVTVTVSWPGMGKATPVTMTTLVTPSAGAGGGDTGSVSVHLTNRNGDPDIGIPVTLDGPSTYTETTNENGCVVFGFVPASDDYTVKFSANNWVNADNVNVVNDPVVVTAGQTNKLQYDYDQGGFTAATFLTRTATGDKPTFPPYFTLFNAGQITPPFAVQVNDTVETNAGYAAGTYYSAWDGRTKGKTPTTVPAKTPLFPFTGPYAVYAGSCATNAPPSSANDAKFVNVSPGAFQNTGPVYLPPIDITVWSGSSSASKGSAVTNAMVQVDAGCAPVWTRYTDGTGKVADTGFPYSSNVKICATAGNRKIAYPNAGAPAAIVNTNYAAGSTPVNIYLGNSNGSSGNPTPAQGCF